MTLGPDISSLSCFLILFYRIPLTHSQALLFNRVTRCQLCIKKKFCLYQRLTLKCFQEASCGKHRSSVEYFAVFPMLPKGIA